MRKKAEKKDGHREAAHEDLPPQSPVYEYGASESSDEPYSDEECGPYVVDQPPAAVDDSDSDDADDADSDSEGSDASEVTS